MANFTKLISAMVLLLLLQLVAAQVNPNPLRQDDPNYTDVDIELLKRVKAGDQALRKRFVAYWIADFGCSPNPDRARNVMTRLYAYRQHSAEGVLDTLSDMMKDAKTTVENAPPSKKKCEEWKAMQDAAAKAAEERVRLIEAPPTTTTQPRQTGGQQTGGQVAQGGTVVSRIVGAVVDGVLGR